ncbi:hypothetical protein EDD11_006516 [Mortierella claussenii]|nr:hypothetical protein EDD11_006516 [Mortierella claussenii]
MAIRPTSDTFPLLVVLNPTAGRKQGQTLLTEVVQPAIAKAALAFELIETTSRGFAQTYFKDNIQKILIDLAQSIGSTAGTDAATADTESRPPPVHSASAALKIMILGGDGTVHEVVNGILRGLTGSSFISDDFRPRIEFSVVPTGTGNAIATSLGITTAQEAVDRFLAGISSPLRVIQVSTQDQSSSSSPYPSSWMPRVYSVVVNSFGLHCATVSDADGFRFLGNERFKIAALKNVVFLKHYQAQLDLYGTVQRYDRSLQELCSATDDAAESADQTKPANKPSLTLLGPFTYLMLTKQAFLEPGFRPTPFAKASDEWLDVLAVQNAGRGQILQVLGAAAKDGKHMGHEKVEYYKAKMVELELSEKGRLCVDGEFLDVEAGPQGRVLFEVVSDPNIQLFHVYG